jgi:hypothetical protein
VQAFLVIDPLQEFTNAGKSLSKIVVFVPVHLRRMPRRSRVEASGLQG